MNEIGDIGGVDSTPLLDAPDSVGDVSAAERADITADVGGVSDDAATKTGDTVLANADTFAAAPAAGAPVPAPAAGAPSATPAAATPVTPATTQAAAEEPGVLEKVGDWVGQTAKGYATGAVNTVLDTASMINKPINAGLDAVGIPYQFPTGVRLNPTSPAERHAQNAVEVATIATGVAGALKSGPALARLTDDAINAGKSLFGIGTATTKVALGDLRAAEIAAIQRAANTAGEDIYVTGSAARAARRNVDSDLPIGTFGQPKAGTRSDIDYAVRSAADDTVNGLNLKLPDMDPSFGVRGVDYINLQSGPAIRFSPFKPPEFLPQGGQRIYLK